MRLILETWRYFYLGQRMDTPTKINHMRSFCGYLIAPHNFRFDVNTHFRTNINDVKGSVWVNFGMRIWVSKLNTLLLTLVLSKMHLTNFRQRCLVTNRHWTCLIHNAMLAGCYGEYYISLDSCQNSSCYPVRLEKSSAFIEISKRQHIVTWNCKFIHFSHAEWFITALCESHVKLVFRQDI